jgi:hypothetical protein
MTNLLFSNRFVMGWSEGLREGMMKKGSSTMEENI